MPQFIIERVVPGASKLTDAELREASLASLAALQQLGPEIRWLHSFVCDDKIYCIYYAPDENTIREHGPTHRKPGRSSVCGAPDSRTRQLRIVREERPDTA